MQYSDFDDYLLHIASKQRSIENFLDLIFDFLRRRTDFFHVSSTVNDEKGFPENQAQQLLNSAFRKHQLTYKQTFKANHKKNVSTALKPQRAVNPKEKTETICSRSQKDKDSFPETSGDINNIECFTDELSTRCTDRKVEAKRISTWNGGRTETFWWNQTLKEVCMDVELPFLLQNKSHVSVSITPRSLKIDVLVPSTGILEGHWSSLLPFRSFYQDIKLSEAVWCVEDQERIVLTFEKLKEDWWPSVFVNDEPIDLNRVESIKTFDELDTETQVALEKVVLDYTNKVKGAPVISKQTEMQQLRDSSNAEGSPFKDTTFDPTFFS